MSRDDPSGSRLGACRSVRSRQIEREEGLAFARSWRVRLDAPRPAQGSYPFRAHRTCSEWRR